MIKEKLGWSTRLAANKTRQIKDVKLSKELAEYEISYNGSSKQAQRCCVRKLFEHTNTSFTNTD